MQAAQDFEQPIDLVVSRSWDKILARWISDLLSPPLIAVAGVLLVASLTRSLEGWLWAGLHLLLTIGAPMGYIAWKVRRGEITDIHIRLREQRIRPMLLTLVCAMFAALLMALIGAAPLMLVFSLMGVFQVGFLLLVTLRWKISGHAAAIGSMTVFLVGVFGSPALPVLALVPLVAWARLRLNRHDLGQTIAGSLAGMAFTLLALNLVTLG